MWLQAEGETPTPPTDASGATSRQGLASVSPTATATFTGTETEVDAAIAAWREEVLAEGVPAVSEPGTVSPMKIHFVNGNCGWSQIEVRDWDYSIYNHLGYVKGSFGLNRPGFAYSTDILLFSSSVLDGWTFHVPDSGNLGGGTQWSKAGQFQVPKTQNYGGTLVHATATTADGICNTSGPRVDGVRIS